MAKSENKVMRRRMAGAWLSSVLSISLVLTLVGVTALLVVNARKVGDFFKESMQISVILRPEVNTANAEAYKAGIDSLYFVKGTTLVTREQGTAELRDMLGEDFLSVFETTPVPISVDVNLKAEYVVADSLEMVTAALNDPRLVDEVQCRQSLVDALNTNISRISMVLAVLIAVMLFLSFVLIGNTVRLGIYARRFTIHTMRLVGATKGFISRPFAAKAVLQGLVSSLLAIGVLGGGLWLLYRSFPQLFVLFVRTDLLVIVAGAIVLCGVLVCLITSWTVVGRILRSSKDDLYY